MRKTCASVLLLIVSGCAHDGGRTSDVSPSPTASESFVLRASPLDLATIRQIVPLGNLNPPDHTLPTDHIYLNTRVSGPPLPAQPVYAPGDGTVRYILRRGAEAKIAVARGAISYYLDHIELDGNIREGDRITAGQVVGRTGAVAYGIDLGVVDSSRTVGFVSPARYSDESLHGMAPLSYFEEPLRSQLYDKVNRAGADRDGRFNYDVAGTLSGNWFLEGLAPADSAGPAGWPRHLAFVRDNFDPAITRVSIGGSLPMVGAYGITAGDPDPATVSVASGKVTFHLMMGAFGQSAGTPVGTMIAQLVEPSRLRVEVLPGSSVSDAEFSSAALTYLR